MTGSRRLRILACAVSLLPASQSIASQEPARAREIGSPAAAETPRTLPIRLSRIRLEAPESTVPQPSALLKFDLVNEGIVGLSDIVLTVTISEKAPDDATGLRTLVRPVDIRSHVTIEPGYTIEFEIVFRNIAADCPCLPLVTVASARPVRD
jgi:hypothetical protein